MTRSDLNRKIGYYRHVILKLDEDIYRQIVRNIDNKSGGYVRNCGLEEANLVLLTLKNLAEKRTATREIKEHSRQENFIPVLMEYLNWKWGDTASFIYKVTGKHHHTSKCDTMQLSKVIRGMISIIDQCFFLNISMIMVTLLTRF